jgi:hypothetical protein
MKKSLLAVSCILFGGANLLAQDTLFVDTLDPNQGQFLNQVIANDNNSHIYKLKRGSIYFIDGEILTTTALNIVGEAGPEATRPAIIRPWIREDGSIANLTFDVSGDLTLKNLYIMSVSLDGGLTQQWAAQVKTDDVVVTIDRCIWEGNGEFGIEVFGALPEVYITNSVFRNCQNEGGDYNGRALWLDQGGERVVLRNNTYLNFYAYVTVDRGSKELIIDHNTVVNCLYTPLFAHQQFNCQITNNIFYNAMFNPQSNLEWLGGWDDFDGEHAAIFSIDTLNATVRQFWDNNVPGGPWNESHRNVVVSNNAYFWSQPFIDLWNSADTLQASRFFNDRTQAFFDDDTNYPNMHEENNVNVEPNFVNRPDTEPLQLEQVRAIRQPNGPTRSYWGFGGPRGTLNWPLPEDLSYDNAALLTAGTDGKPLGDLNWFGLATRVESPEQTEVPEDFALLQNYPNPFNPTTSITYKIARVADVKLSIYNLHGQKLRTLVDERKAAGAYTVKWDGNDELGRAVVSGIYFCKLEAGEFVQSQKMLFVK